MLLGRGPSVRFVGISDCGYGCGFRYNWSLPVSVGEHYGLSP
jgi:hypothetical protein